MALAAVFFKPQVNQKAKFFDSFDQLRLKIDETPRCINYDFITKKPMGQNVIYTITEKETRMLNLFTRAEKN